MMKTFGVRYFSADFRFLQFSHHREIQDDTRCLASGIILHVPPHSRAETARENCHR